MEFKIAFIGFGIVGQGLAKILVNERNMLKTHYGLEFKVVAISDKQKGSVYNPNGLDLQRLLKIVKNSGKIDSYDEGAKGWGSIKTITDTNANLIVEVSWTDINTGEPAISHVKTALNNGKHVVMTNKGPVALAANELLELAKENNVEMRFEGTVLSGTPAIALGVRNLAGGGISAVRGIVNGTTNYILTEMENGLTYSEALKHAQELGYAESDPTADVEGHDALAKILILANVVLGGHLTKDHIPCQGITKISKSDIEIAKAGGKRWKLIAAAKIKQDGSVEAYVRPEKIDLNQPLASVMGPTNAITYSTKFLGDVTLIGPGAGKAATGYALLSDILDIHRTLTK
jgi:homoserine dehydrogenase